jgi:hypothetical protein
MFISSQKVRKVFSAEIYRKVLNADAANIFTDFKIDFASVANMIPSRINLGAIKEVGIGKDIVKIG